MRKSQTRNVEASGTVLGTRLLAEARQRGEGAQERPLRRVLRGVMVGELVEREGVHLGEVLPVQGVELGGVPASRLDEGAVAVEGDDRSRSPPARVYPTPRRATALHLSRHETHADDLARVDDALAGRRAGVLDDEAAGRGVDPQRPDGADRSPPSRRPVPRA